MMPDHVKPFIAARDLLLRLRTDYPAAIREFRWPGMERFNWALDYFDHLPADALALWCIGEVEERLSFGDLRTRSNQVANHLRALGVRRGDRVLLLLPNVRQLFEAMLALMKLGAVFSPSTTLLTEAELADRVRRGHMRHAIVHASMTGRFADLPGEYTRIAVGAAAGWHRFEDAYEAAETFVPDGATALDIFVNMRGRLAPYKRIRRIEFAEELPLTISGKIRRADLRRQEAQRRHDGVRGAAEFWEEDFPELTRAGR
ncbi:MAG TPA: AMP-binding protein [Stellaceae bacterium]|nr:AMP-binding protein [Stellaceae bacterium]